VGKTIWITGTGTGVGKTVLTSLLTIHMRQAGIDVLACKPYASGSWEDTETLSIANEHLLRLDQITPIFCEQPVAPLVGFDKKQADTAVGVARESVLRHAKQCDVLLVEGIGGAAVPVSHDQTIGTTMADLVDGTIIVGQNKLGILNEILLTNHYLRSIRSSSQLITLMGVEDPDTSSEYNSNALKEVLGSIPVISLPFLGRWNPEFMTLKETEKKFRKTLAQIRDWVNVFSADTARPVKPESQQ